MKKVTSADPTTPSSTDTPAAEPLTYEEYRARAMLLGRDFWYLSFVLVSHKDEDYKSRRFIDPDTLLPVDRFERQERYKNEEGVKRCPDGKLKYQLTR